MHFLKQDLNPQEDPDDEQVVEFYGIMTYGIGGALALIFLVSLVLLYKYPEYSFATGGFLCPDRFMSWQFVARLTLFVVATLLVQFQMDLVTGSLYFLVFVTLFLFDFMFRARECKSTLERAAEYVGEKAQDVAEYIGFDPRGTKMAEEIRKLRANPETAEHRRQRIMWELEAIRGERALGINVPSRSQTPGMPVLSLERNSKESKESKDSVRAMYEGNLGKALTVAYFGTNGA